jgi:signal transduction histidine kinase
MFSRFRSTSFRWALAIGCAFLLCIAVLFGLVYWQTTVYLTEHFDRLIERQAKTIAALPPGDWNGAVGERADSDRVASAGIFDAAGRRISGNIANLPSNLVPDGVAAGVTITRIDPDGPHGQLVRAVAVKLGYSERLVVGRGMQEDDAFAKIIERALALSLLPALALAMLAGTLLSKGARRRIEAWTALVSQIYAGNLQQRLPVVVHDHPFDKLSVIINGMLEHIEQLVGHLANVGNDIAHDLRTPLTRVRAILERARENAQTVDELRNSADRAIDGLDQSLAVVTALLRIAAIEHGRRTVEFGNIDLAEVVGAAVELYDPIAEDRHIQLDIDFRGAALIVGDRDLLFEVAANLIDNAIKFTPEGGKVSVAIFGSGGDVVLQVSDTGSGIGEAEREVVTRRFYRADKSRRAPGAGLGLSLVAAIVKLHGFRLDIRGGPGCIIEIICPTSS